MKLLISQLTCISLTAVEASNTGSGAINLYRIFALGAFCIGIVLAGVIFYLCYLYYQDYKREQKRKKEMGFLRMETGTERDNLWYETQLYKSEVAPDWLDPNPADHIKIGDEGRTIYKRSFTIQVMSKKVRFASTFAPLFNFNNCISSVFIFPEEASVSSRKLDRRAIVLEGEEIAAAKQEDTNKLRKLRTKYSETTAWAEAVESGDVKFYETGFLFTLQADDYLSLNKASDSFVSKAKDTGIELVSCFGMQSEAFMTNMPMNTIAGSSLGVLKKSGIKFHPFDRAALSSIFNHTQTDFVHMKGVPIGYNKDTGRTVMYDLYSKDHDGYTLVIAGKTGCGKSTVLKCFCSRERLEGTRFCCIDSQARGTVGEYAASAKAFNGINIPIKNKEGGVILNFFEIKESKKFITDSTSEMVGQEIETLELANKMAEVINIIFSMIYRGKDNPDFSLDVSISDIVTDCVGEVYKDLGIVDGDVNSLFKDGKIVQSGALTSGRIRKDMPTISDFYKKVLLREVNENDKNLKEACKIIVSAVKTYVKEVYYSEKTRHFFTREEYAQLPGETEKYWRNSETGENETVVMIKGIRAYYDGQSTVTISNESPFTNFDISQLPEEEKDLARQICMSYITENFIKKNSENLKSANRMVLIIDEAHEQFKMKHTRLSLSETVRTARKRNVGIIISTQELIEFDEYPETRSILANATTKFVFKQSPSSSEFLKKNLELTDSELEHLLSLGGSGDMSDLKNPNARRGEMCIVDNRKVTFCKVEYDYFKETEGFIVETSAAEVEKLYAMQARV